MAHFYLDEALTPPQVGERVSLSGSEARHAVTVSRQSAGESISVGNGAGLVVTGTIESAQPAELVLVVEEVSEHPRREPAIFLAQALAKGDRDELAVQAATELGVDGVIPWQASRSISRWEGAKVAKGRDRWTAIVREASKQSLRAWVPDVLDIATTRQLAAFASGARMLVLEPTAETALGSLDFDGRDLILVVGPEGGISPQEREVLENAGAESVRLGTEVLRTSTAGPAALGALNVLLGRW
ncbi:16S rRNA (uracil1498-N3)-methyltransferase [Leifsonia sp. AK011]|uniref:16S rRNA (uracil(1498)-N(3))-methyltransferase n=1 Tax=Leifsonia sp. AK011 TaxID=2723075 RepID=UPI0015CE461C|nr:16S rRNA (uracil(1498)-N(3))-methyltransferase [Leifsonia sp. AK011]NYF10963.1 16S rRNA (uracil1498-N3)-methyltransferase [Leifsonia sp. AK011]